MKTKIEKFVENNYNPHTICRRKIGSIIKSEI